MRIDVITVQPKMLEGFLTESILGRAARKGICTINLVDLRDFGEGRWKKVDDKPYGGGPGMLMKCGPWFAAVESCLGRAIGGEDARRETGDARREGARIIMTSPAGRTFTQRDAEMFACLNQPSTPSPQPSTPSPQPPTPSPQPPTPNPQPPTPHLIFLCGHYEGFDARIETLATDVFSVGDFVMTGGELAAAAMIDAIVRLLPGVLGGGPAATSSESFSLADASVSDSRPSLLLEAPQYTHPPDFRGMKVPEVLLSGDHAKIDSWRRGAARERTARLRPDLICPPSPQTGTGSGERTADGFRRA